jgi:L-alanine-DL-glutamate epimerase-like enolase superfamily enzyme
VAAPLAIAYTHVHSLRLASGAEALVARVLAADGTAGFGFTLNDDAGVARDMATWDALARSKGVPLYGLFGRPSPGKRIRIEKDETPSLAPDWSALRKAILEKRYKLLRIDPFAWGSVEMVQTIAASAQGTPIALLAPNAHPWEIQYCAALVATFEGNDSRIILRRNPSETQIQIKQPPGMGIDWALEPGFSKLRWVEPA